MTKKKTLSVEFIETILSLYPDYDSIRGPYLKSNGNTYIVLNNSKLKKTDKNKLKPILYAKAIVEFNLKKKIDNGLIFNFKDNNPENIHCNKVEPPFCTVALPCDTSFAVGESLTLPNFFIF